MHKDTPRYRSAARDCTQGTHMHTGVRNTGLQKSTI